MAVRPRKQIKAQNLTSEFVGPLSEQQTVLLAEFRSLYKLHGQDVALDKEPRLLPLYETLEKAIDFMKRNGNRFDKKAKNLFLDHVRECQLQQIVLDLPPEEWEEPSEADMDDITSALVSPGKGTQEAFPFSQ